MLCPLVVHLYIHLHILHSEVYDPLKTPGDVLIASLAFYLTYQPVLARVPSRSTRLSHRSKVPEMIRSISCFCNETDVACRLGLTTDYYYIQMNPQKTRATDRIN